MLSSIRRNTARKGSVVCLCFMLLTLACSHAHALQVQYMGRLANFQGIVPSLWGRIAVDRERAEVFVLDPRRYDVRIFNEYGMEVFEFGDNLPLAGASDIDLGEDGEIWLLSRARQEIYRLDYKGDLINRIEIDLKNVPEEFLPFHANRLQFLDGKLYLGDTNSMIILVTDTNASFLRGYAVDRLLRQMEGEFEGRPGEEMFKEDKIGSTDSAVGMGDFVADSNGNIFFTVPTLFAGFKIPAGGGQLKMFGRPGSAPGKFGVVTGITVDRNGTIYVTDRLRSVVLIFDSKFEFITEFGYRGLTGSNLLVPDDVAVDDQHATIYVAQAGYKGVSFFRILNQ